MCNAYWFIGVTDEKGKANMALVTEDVSFILASVGKLRITDHVHIAKVPLYTNIAIIKKGEELLSYMPKVEKSEDAGAKKLRSSRCVFRVAKRMRWRQKAEDMREVGCRTATVHRIARASFAGFFVTALF